MVSFVTQLCLRTVTKPGRCPRVSSNSTRCEQECITDADCSGEMKCCNTGCGTSCLEPAAEVPVTSPRPWVTSPPAGAEPASIKQPEEPKVSAQEGGYVTLHCMAYGNPKPTITWRKDTTLVSGFRKGRSSGKVKENYIFLIFVNEH